VHQALNLERPVFFRVTFHFDSAGQHARGVLKNIKDLARSMIVQTKDDGPIKNQYLEHLMEAYRKRRYLRDFEPELKERFGRMNRLTGVVRFGTRKPRL
jgi:hypothetical protein